MKKLMTAFLGLAMATSLAACAPSEMPEDKIEAAYILSEDLDSEGKLLLEVGEEYTYDLTLPVEGCEVTVQSKDAAIKAYVDSENKELTLLAKEAVEGEISLTFEAKRYAVTSVPVPVSAQPGDIDFELELTPENDESIVLEEDVIKVPVGQTASIKLDSLEGTEYSIKEQVDGVEATIEDDVLTITPKSNIATKINIVATKDDCLKEGEKTIDVVGVGTVDLSLDTQQLNLLPGEKATVKYTTDVKGDVEAVVEYGDAKAEVLEGIVEITGGYKNSKVQVKAGAESWITGTKEIGITVKELPKEEPAPAPPKEEIVNENSKQTTSQDKTEIAAEKTKPAPKQDTSEEQTPSKVVDTSEYADDIAGIIKYTNKMREEAGLPKLEHVEVVDTPATLRAEEASEKWSHTRPDGSMYHTIFAECGLSYGTNGENLFMANTYLSPKKVVEEWMNSKGHRENILRPEFTGIGVGCFEINGEVYWTQLFVG